MDFGFKKQIIGFALIGGFLTIAPATQATTLTSNVNVDNGFQEYLSSSPTDLTNAILINSGGNWGATNTSVAPLISGSTEYLVVETLNWGGPGGFLGSFSLSDSNAQFANGTQTLLTGDSAWSVALINPNNDIYTNNIIGTYTSTTSEGVNGVSPWGNYINVNPNAVWIADSTYAQGNSSGNVTDVFITTITNNNVSSVPLPSALPLFASGLIGLGVYRRKTSKA
jgi:hypothetical protein